MRVVARAAAAWAAAIVVVATALTALASVAIDDASVPERQRAEYQAETAKTILALQAFRRTMASPIEDARGRSGNATLVNLNPGVNAWFLLSLAWYGPDETEVYHLENANPRTQSVVLDELTGDLVIRSAGKSVDCALWSGQGPGSLRQARESRLPYAPLCADRLYLRNVVAGTFSPIERVTEFLRDHVWGGDAIVTFVRKHAFQDSFARMGLAGEPAPEPAVSAQTPRAAQIRDADRAVAINPEDLGIDVDGSPGSLLLGRWYAVSGSSGIFASVMRPGAVSAEIAASYPARVNPLDSVESQALDYLVAMDLAQYELHFALGTDHPRVSWSERALDTVRMPDLPGPDGIGSVAPLVVNGMVSPALIGRIAASFAGGFKREHGAFRYGALAQQNHGSHYGFIEQGVVFSKLQPGLATLYAGIDGQVAMKTWTRDDDGLLDRIVDARQNGVPLIESDAASGAAYPGLLVNQWGAGNWSGSVDERLRTVRGGACLQQTPGRRFLVFAYFSTATPSAMARVFQSFGCRYAMQLDINALEHTYFALYTHDQGHLIVQHLAQGMAEVDRKGGDQLAPRFLGFPDDRDFFYLLKRELPP